MGTADQNILPLTDKNFDVVILTCPSDLIS